MPRKNSKAAIADQPILESAADRFRWVLERRWNGNQSAMARDLGCQQSVISKVARGRHSPGYELLHKLAAQPGLNRDWVLTGKGDPFPQSVVNVGSEMLLPIARTPLPGPQIRAGAAFTSNFHPVRPATFSKDRYFLELQPGTPATTDPDAKLRPGDLLLVETESIWRRDPSLLGGRICLIRRAVGRASTISLGRVDCHYPAEGELLELTVRYFGRTESPKPLRRALAFLDEPHPKQKQADPDTETSIDDIVGVVVEMVRPTP